MEPNRFDAFVRALDGALSRRRALAAMLVSLPAAAFPALETAGKGKRGRGKGKRGGERGRGRISQDGQEPQGAAAETCDLLDCLASGGCCAGDVCVHGAGQWRPRPTFGRKGDGPDQFDRPAGVALSGDEQTAWVADTENHRIAVWIRSGDQWSSQTTFGSRGSGPNQFNEPNGVAVSADGQTVWVADTGNHRIAVWTKSAQAWSNQTTFGSHGSGPDQFDDPRGVAVSADGQTVWIADADNERISIWTRSGSGWINQGAFGRKGDGSGEFDRPAGVAVSTDGQTVWVADAGNHRISVWTRSGNAWVNQSTFGRKGNAPSEFSSPAGVAVSTHGQSVWVADTGNDRVSVWTRSGGGWANLTTFGRKGNGLGQFNGPAGVAVSANGQTIWVAELDANRVSVWTRSALIWSNQANFGRQGDGGGQFNDPIGVAVSADGQTVWVADSHNDRVSVWQRSGSGFVPQAVFGSRGSGPNQFNTPNDVAVAADGQTVWVADRGNNRVSVWTRSGNAWVNQTTFGSRGVGPSGFNGLSAVEVSPDGETVWVADTGNNRISVWTRSGNAWVNQATFGSRGDGPDQFWLPGGVAASANGQFVWVADTNNNRISVWTRSGSGWSPQTTFGSRGNGLDQFNGPSGVAVSADRQTVWVADASNARIAVWTRLTSSWAPQTTFGSRGSGANQFNAPIGVAAADDGQTVLVADTANNRISVWALICPPA